jgi:hypothetical protein
MLWKATKFGVLSLAAAAVVGGVVFGSDMVSYVRSSCHWASHTVSDNIPLDFQIRRARDLLAETEPEMRKNVRLMAEEEVDIAGLKDGIVQAAQSLDEEKGRLAKLRDKLSTSETSFTFGEFSYSREQLAQELARRFEFYQEAETALLQKRQLLISRQKALAAAAQAMEVARAQRSTLEAEIGALEGRYRLVQATSGGGDMRLDNSSLARADQVVGEVRRQLDISEHVLAREAKFIQPMAIDTVNEKDLLKKVADHLSGKDVHATAAAQPSSDALSDATAVGTAK